MTIYDELIKVKGAYASIVSDYNLLRIDADIIRRAENESCSDENLIDLIMDFKILLLSYNGPHDNQKSSQLYEVYGEIIVYRHLKHYGFSPRKIQNSSSKTPDFECFMPRNDKKFYVEVKSYDVFGGIYTGQVNISSSLDSNIEMDQQKKRKGIGFGVWTAQTYNPDRIDMIKNVIDTMSNKFLQNFRLGQFAMGPTFSVAFTGRFIIPGRDSSLTPYYLSHSKPSSIVSGVLWHSAYGTIGSPVLGFSDFEGSGNFEGILDQAGFFNDTNPHPSVAHITFDQSLNDIRVYGQPNHKVICNNNWSQFDTEYVLKCLCDFHNSIYNENGYLINRELIHNSRLKAGFQ